VAQEQIEHGKDDDQEEKGVDGQTENHGYGRDEQSYE
jgi:hypothetical protein